MKNLANLIEESIESIDNLPSRDKVRPPEDGRDHYKGCDYPWGKVYRFLTSRVGRPWDRVFSEYVHLDWIPRQYKTQEQISHSVLLNTFMRDGKVWYYDKYLSNNERQLEDCGGYWRHSELLYVHPTTKVLCYYKPKRIDYKKQQAEERAKTFRILGDYHQLIKTNGIWHEIKGEPVKSEIIEINGLHYRPLIGLPLPSKSCKMIGGQIYMGCPRDDRKTIGPRERMMEENDPNYRRNYYRFNSKNYDSVKITHCRQLNSKELKKHGLKNDVKPITYKKCEVCGNYGDKEPCYHQLRQSL